MLLWRFMAGFFRPHSDVMTNVIDAYQKYREISNMDSLVTDQTLLFSVLNPHCVGLP